MEIKLIATVSSAAGWVWRLCCSVPPSDLLLRLGEHDLSSEDEPYKYQERRIQIVASHPQFDPRTFEYDLALLRFYEPVAFQPNIIPICVPEDDRNFVGDTAFVTGWGRLYESEWRLDRVRSGAITCDRLWLLLQMDRCPACCRKCPCRSSTTRSVRPCTDPPASSNTYRRYLSAPAGGKEDSTLAR